MFPPVEIFVGGQPKGQPRARAFAFRGNVRMYDPATAEGWKSAIADEWRRSAPKMPKIETPVSLALHFLLPRPKAHFTKKGLRLTAPVWFAKKPDADNFAKAVMDCLTQLGVWQDDALVVVLLTSKRYTQGRPGCRIVLSDAAVEEVPR
ncbi:MAG: RusA family crossover junction endodeoxyribonuclease [Patescibacteria group bacterium]|nr:RusA family crossover junction endodeoxyribonuclease [Patescibacteria group bacterium]